MGLHSQIPIRSTPSEKAQGEQERSSVSEDAYLLSNQAPRMYQEIRKNTASAVDRVKLVLNRNSSTEIGCEEEDGVSQISHAATDQLEALAEHCPELTFQQRLIGFAASFSIGYLIAFMSFRFFIHLIQGHPIPFALNYTLGHILQLMASTFLCGPKRQLKNMFDDKRKITSTVYLSCLVGNLIIVFLPLPASLKLILLLTGMLIQLTASVWYTLSYIPYGRRTAIRILKSALGGSWDESSGNIDYSIVGFGNGSGGGGVLS